MQHKKKLKYIVNMNSISYHKVRYKIWSILKIVSFITYTQIVKFYC